MKSSTLTIVIATLLLAACGGAPPPSAPPPVVPPPATVVATEHGSIDRAQLETVLAQGLGRFLQRVTTEPHLDGGHFVGHRLVELRSDLFEGIDIRAGDTLIRVNGSSVERPEQALRVWDELRVASELRLEILRDGQPRTLLFNIVE